MSASRFLFSSRSNRRVLPGRSFSSTWRRRLRSASVKLSWARSHGGTRFFSDITPCFYPMLYHNLSICKGNKPKTSPDLEYGRWLNSRPRFVRESLMISRFFDFSPKPGSCPESPDSRIIPARQKISSRKREGGSQRLHLATQEWLTPESSISRDRLLSAPIWNLGGYRKITARFAGLIAFFAEPASPRLRLE